MINSLFQEGKKLLIRPEVAESANKANVIVGEPRKGKEDNKVLGRQVVLGKQPDGKEVIKITIKNPTLGGQLQVQENARVRFVKPKSPEIGKWKRNEVKVQCKRIKPTFDMLLSKYTNQSAGSSFNQSTHLKRPRSPLADMFSQYMKPSGPRVLFPEEHTQSVWDQLDYSYRGRLNIGGYQSAGQNMRLDGNYPSARMHPGGSYPSEKMWSSRFHPTEFHPSGFH